MKMNRVWANANKWTFQIKPIRDLLKRYVNNGKGWFDPFSGKFSPAEITNDINPEMNTTYNMECTKFVKSLNGKYNGCIWDPPYSMEQISRSYKNHGLIHWQDKNIAGKSGTFASTKNKICKIIKLGGYYISFGWNSGGIGKRRGFEIVEILLVCHGRNKNDTICTVEQKFQEEMF